MDFVRPEVIGDFPEGEACRFFTEQAIPGAGIEVDLSKDDWGKIWEVWATLKTRIRSSMLAIFSAQCCSCYPCSCYQPM